MKIRCIDKDSPPCRRCKTLGVPCSFEANEVVVDRNPRHRLDALESQMSSINDKLDGFDSLMRSFLAASQPSDFRPPVIEQSSSQVSATTGNILAPPCQSGVAVLHTDNQCRDSQQLRHLRPLWKASSSGWALSRVLHLPAALIPSNKTDMCSPHHPQRCRLRMTMIHWTLLSEWKL